MKKGNLSYLVGMALGVSLVMGGAYLVGSVMAWSTDFSEWPWPIRGIYAVLGCMAAAALPSVWRDR